MKIKTKTLIDIKKIFDIKKESMPHGSWWWWFWLFFIDNPKNHEKPEQLMILWSTKNVKEMSCNDLKIKLNSHREDGVLPGVVASWYFDGENMNHNLIEQCNFKISDKELFSHSNIPTSFSINKNKNMIKIGNDFELIAELENKHNFTKPFYESSNYIGNKGYSMIRLVHTNLTGRIKNKTIKGSAFFHRIFMNAPSPSWYWGLFHFENGSILTYFNPYLFGKSLKKDITFFDGNKVHRFNDINIKISKGKLPIYSISGKNECEKISFTVNSYSNFSWTLRKKSLGIIPNKLIYNEYPAVISDFELINNKTGKKIIFEDLGKSTGNAEHTIGFLL
jgi:hypothetical protein